MAVVPPEYVPDAGNLNLTQRRLNFTQGHVSVEHTLITLEFIDFILLDYLPMHPRSEHLNVGYLACAHTQFHIHGVD
jgi:hypothetical protein